MVTLIGVGWAVKSTILAAIVTATLGFATQASAITFDFTGGSGPQSTLLQFNSGGVSLSISTAIFDSNFNIYETTPVLDQGAAGLGMLNRYNDKGIGIDGWGKFELAVFQFDRQVILNSITLALIPNKYNTAGTNMAFRFWEEVGSLKDNGGAYTKASSGPFSFPAATIGDLFGIGANKRKTEFRISSINVSLSASASRIAQVAPVPLSATLPLFAGVLGLMGWLGRRKYRI